MASVHAVSLSQSRFEDSQSLIDSIFSLHRPRPAHGAWSRLAAALAAPVLGRRAVAVGAACLLLIAATAGVGLSRIATTPQGAPQSLTGTVMALAARP
jgi:hypothetical protein